LGVVWPTLKFLFLFFSYAFWGGRNHSLANHRR